MIIYLSVVGGYVDFWGTTRSSDNDVKVNLDKNHDFFNTDCHAWKYIDGELIFDEEKEQELIVQHEKEQNKLTVDDLNTLAIFELAQQIEELKGGV